uniref:Cytokine receptor family B2 n=1 Tax=Scleropages formosus TaxID=113540 RepID=A0A8F8SXM5_SCLFO|nr:cytokine receptor family B2 [Scleropages formosus]
MTPPSWLLLFTSLLLASSGLCELPAPVNVSISSFGFIHILTWEPGPMSPSNLCYSVKVHIVINATWLRVPECQCVQTPRLCNLTKTFSDVWESYAVSVWAVLGDQNSSLVMLDPVVPISITHPDPPLVFVSECRDNLCVKLESPSGHLNYIYNKFTYKLTIENGSNSPLTKNTEGLKDVTLKNLDPGRNYCVTVSIKDKTARSIRQCAYLSSTYKTEILVIPSLVAMFCVLLFTLVYCRRFSLRTNLPDILLTVKSSSMLPLPLDYDKPACTWVVLGEAELPRRHQLAGGSDSEEENEQNVEGKVYRAVGSYEQRPKQPHHSGSQSDPSIIDLMTPHCSPKGSEHFLFCPAPVASNQVLFSDSQSLCVPLDDDCFISGSVGENGQILIDVPLQLSQVENAREQDCKLSSFLGLGRPELEPKDQNGSEVQEMKLCSDVNLFSVTLGKYKEEENETQENEDTLVSLCSPREYSVLPMATISDSCEDLYSEVEEDVIGCSGYMRR